MLAPFRHRTEKKPSAQSTAYTMARMNAGNGGLRLRQGTETAAGHRNRWEARPAPPNDNSDAWFLGYTPQLLAGAWIGCDDRFIHLESGLGIGGEAARPIWEYFFQQGPCGQDPRLNKQELFAKPDSVGPGGLYDYEKAHR